MAGDRPQSSRELDWQSPIETALTAPGSIGNTYSRFHQYSFLNNLLLRMQGVEGPVATYDRWRSVGRQVLKGSKAAEIVRPITIAKKNDDGEVESSFTRFKFVRCIFGYNQTEGDELLPVETPGWDLNTALGQLDIKRVPFRELNGNVQGFSWGRNIAINPVATDPLGTTYHELGHVVLGHTEPDKATQYVLHRGVYEFQAGPPRI
jgi:N-terminal domain of anti-restriction factor ArdC